MKNRKRKMPKVYYSMPRPKDQEKYFQTRKEELEKQEERLREIEEQFAVSKNLLDDTLHEIRKINNQIKANTLQLSTTLEAISIEDDGIDKHVHNTLKTLDGNTSLLSIRMDAYDLTLNPASSGSEIEADLGVYSKVEKVYKCLYYNKKSKDLTIHLRGNTDRKYRLRNSIELAFFIIIENAIKYSPRGNEISINFVEQGENLNVEFENLAICPKLEELPHLTDRGYRSEGARKLRDIKGNGLGLFLLKNICHSNNVKYQFIIKENSKLIEGKTYNIFCVVLTFFR